MQTEDDFAHKGHGFRMPTRWPHRFEMKAASARADAARGITAFTPTKLGEAIIEDQMGSSECFGFAVCQAVNLRHQARDDLKPHRYSPVVPYYEARRVRVPSDDFVVDDGSDPDAMIQAVADFGVCSWESAPFDMSRVNARPGDLAYQGAQSFQCRLTPIFESGIALWDAVRYAIQYLREPPLLAIEVTPAYDRPINGIVDERGGSSRGLHAICADGFDDDGLWTDGSWSTRYGIEGRVKLTPDFLAARCVWAGSLEVIG